MDQEFKENVWKIAKLIPRGRVTTYGAIAKAIGFPNHSRLVGKSMGGCPTNVPAHRVIAASGMLRVPAFKQKLEKEGILVVNERVKNFKKIFWNPLTEIGLEIE